MRGNAAGEIWVVVVGREALHRAGPGLRGNLRRRRRRKLLSCTRARVAAPRPAVAQLHGSSCHNTTLKPYCQHHALCPAPGRTLHSAQCTCQPCMALLPTMPASAVVLTASLPIGAMRLSLLAPVYSNNNQGQGMAGDLAAQEDKGLCMAIDLQVQGCKWEKEPGTYNPEERVWRLCLLLPGEPKNWMWPKGRWPGVTLSARPA